MCARRWLDFCQRYQKNPRRLKFSDVIEFLNACLLCKYVHSTFRVMKTFMIECRKLVGYPFTAVQENYLHKVTKGIFNKYPPPDKHKKPFTWNINTVLDYLKTHSGEVREYWFVAAKAIMLIMLSTMCHLADARVIKMSKLTLTTEGLEIYFDTPPKMLTEKTLRNLRDHRAMFIKQFHEDETLCPVRALEAYFSFTVGICETCVIMCSLY